MKHLFKILIIFSIFLSPTFTAATEEVDEERYTSGGQWEISSEDAGFIKYTEQDRKLAINPDDILEGRSFSDEKDINDSYQVHTVYILASDSKDKKLDINGTIKKILEDKLLLKNTGEWVSIMEKEKIPCGPIFNIKEAVENPQVESRNMIVKAHHKVIGDFKLAGNPIKMSAYKDEKTRGDIPDLDEHRKKILEEFNN